MDPSKTAETKPSIPKKTDPEWTEYVLSLMSEKEVYNGNPRVDAMRRVIPIVLGRITESYSKVIAAPSKDNDKRATVEYHIHIDVYGYHYGRDTTFKEHYGASADAYIGNVSSPPNKKVGFHEYPVAMAETRAAGRAMRHALCLVGVVAAEEIAELGEVDSFITTRTEITPGQVSAIQSLCKLQNINVTKFINMGKGDYLNLSEVPYDVAVNMSKLLNEYRNGKPVPEEIKA